MLFQTIILIIAKLKKIFFEFLKKNNQKLNELSFLACQTRILKNLSGMDIHRLNFITDTMIVKNFLFMYIQSLMIYLLLFCFYYCICNCRVTKWSKC